MQERENTKKSMKNFIDIARRSKYTDSMIMNIGIVCGSEQIAEKGYTTEQAFTKAIQLVKQGKSASETIFEMLKLAGYEE